MPNDKLCRSFLSDISIRVRVDPLIGVEKLSLLNLCLMSLIFRIHLNVIHVTFGTLFVRQDVINNENVVGCVVVVAPTVRVGLSNTTELHNTI